MTQLNISSSRLLNKVARGLHVASGRKTFYKNPAEDPGIEFSQEESSPEGRAAEGNSLYETTSAPGVIFPGKEIPAADVKKTKDAAEIRPAAPEAIVENSKRMKISPQMHSDEPIIDSPRPQKNPADIAADYPRMVQELFTAAPNRKDSLPENIIPGEKQRKDGLIRPESHIQKKDEFPAVHSSGQSFNGNAQKYFPSNKISKREIIEQTDSPVVNKLPAGIVNHHPGKYNKKQSALSSAVTKAGEALKSEAVSPTEKVSPHGEETIPVNESTSLSVAREIRKDRVREISAIADTEQKLNTIGDYIGTNMLKANSPAKAGILQPEAVHNKIPEIKEKAKSVHIGAINIQIKEREAGVQESWPEPPHYTNHVITEDWDWSCQYGK
jgi:hypothetical protein